MTSQEFAVNPRNKVERARQRASYDKQAVFAVLDEARICHGGFVVNGQPFVIPMVYGRVAETLYLHGSVASRMMQSLGQGLPLSVSVTLIDGIVLAQSAFHHSMNYRSVVAFGTGRLVTDVAERAEALKAITNHMLPGRYEQVREPNRKELNATSIIAMPIEDATAKARSGPPNDDVEDLGLSAWVGVIPVAEQTGEPIAGYQPE